MRRSKRRRRRDSNKNCSGVGGSKTVKIGWWGWKNKKITEEEKIKKGRREGVSKKLGFMKERASLTRGIPRRLNN